MHGASSCRRIAKASRALHDELDASSTMQRAVHLAAELVPVAEDACISIARKGVIVATAAWTRDHALDAEQLQFAVGDGPLLRDVWEHEVVCSSDLVAEDRWPGWVARVTNEAKVRGFVSVALASSGRRLGAMTFYSTEPQAFTADDVDICLAYSTHVAIAVETAGEDVNKSIAMESRSLIGQATGVLMQRYEVDADRAFAVLRRVSQDTNTKLHAVALEVIETRTLPS